MNITEKHLGWILLVACVVFLALGLIFKRLDCLLYSGTSVVLGIWCLVSLKNKQKTEEMKHGDDEA